MTKLRVTRTLAAGSAGLVLALGVGAASAHGGGNWGSQKNNKVDNSVTTATDNSVGIDNTNTQNALSGDASVNGSKDKGHDWNKDSDSSDSSAVNGATTGAATNGNTTKITVGITADPSSPAPASDSGNKHSSVDNSVTTTVSNDVTVSNDSTQNAISGNASVNGNLQGSSNSATTGDATNTNDTTIGVTIQ